MILRIHDPLDVRPRSIACPALPKALGECVPNPGAVMACQVNGVFREEWRGLIPEHHDQIDFFVGKPGVGPEWGFVIVTLVSIALNTALSFLMPKPRSPNIPLGGTSPSRPAEAFGIAGLVNTIAPGTPKFVIYGQRRVFGHLIGTSVDIASDGKGMTFGALYFMGDTGGDGYEDISQVEINDIGVADLPNVTTDVRLGSSVQTVIPGFETVSQVFYDGRSLVYNTPLTYTTQGTTVAKAKVILQYPGGLRRVDPNSGADLSGHSSILVEFKKPADVGWTTASTTTFDELSLSALYKQITVTFPSVDQWQLRVTETHDKNSTTPPTATQDATLYNLDEIQANTRSYPNSALLAVQGVASAQIQSLDSMRVSALVKGKKVNVWDGSVMTLQWTQQRAWICRDILTHQKVGLGHRFSASLHDDNAALAAQAVWNADALDEDGNTETLDQCDVILNERRSGWDWLKDLLAEGRGSYIPSGGKYKLVVDHAVTPRLPWAMPGNIIEGSLKIVLGTGQKSLNTLRGQFPDATKAEKTNIIELRTADAEPEGSEPIRDKGYTYISLIRQSNVARELGYQLKKQALTRSWQFTANQGAQISEPLDVDYLSYQTTDYLRGYSGFVGEAGTALQLYLDRPVTLEADTTYEVILRRPDNTTDTRTIADGPGTWGLLSVTEAFTTPPAAGDIWALGKQHEHILPVQIQSVKPNDDGTVDVVAQEYDEDVYVASDLPAVVPANYLTTSSFPPIPLADARVREQVISNKDGSWASSLFFDISPGLVKQAGNAQAGAASTITLASTELAFDDAFNAAVIEIVNGTGTGQQRTISDYVGSTKVAMVDAVWVTNPDSSSQYVISRLRYAPLGGFSVEEGASSSGPWTTIGQFSGLSGKLPGAGPGRTAYYRFTPLSDANIPNPLGRIVQSLTIQGDVTAPAAPSAVDVSSYLKALVVEITMDRPTAIDLAGWEVEIWKDDIGGSGTSQGVFRVGVPQDNAGSGSMKARQTFALPTLAVGDTVLARARSVDGSNNKSAYTDSGSTVLTGASNVTTSGGGSGSVGAGGTSTIHSASVTTNGGKVLVTARLFVTLDDLVSSNLTWYLQRAGVNYDICSSISREGCIVLIGIDETAPPGSNTYDIVGQNTGTGNATVSDASLTITEY